MTVSKTGGAPVTHRRCQNRCCEGSISWLSAADSDTRRGLWLEQLPLNVAMFSVGVYDDSCSLNLR
jgi:hypothetical protein